MMKLAAAALLALTAAPAVAASYVTDTSTYGSLGDTIGSPFDIVTLNSVTGTATTFGTYLVNTVDFTVGVNATVAATSSGTLTNTATVDGSPFTYTVPYTITIGGSDSITLGGNTFYTDGVKVHFNALTFTDVGVGQTASGDLTATISVPEPATWAMMVAGFGLVGLGVRRRSAAVVAA